MDYLCNAVLALTILSVAIIYFVIHVMLIDAHLVK